MADKLGYNAVQAQKRLEKASKCGVWIRDRDSACIKPVGHNGHCEPY